MSIYTAHAALIVMTSSVSRAGRLTKNCMTMGSSDLRGGNNLRRRGSLWRVLKNNARCMNDSQLMAVMGTCGDFRQLRANEAVAITAHSKESIGHRSSARGTLYGKAKGTLVHT